MQANSYWRRRQGSISFTKSLEKLTNTIAVPEHNDSYVSVAISMPYQLIALSWMELFRTFLVSLRCITCFHVHSFLMIVYEPTISSRILDCSREVHAWERCLVLPPRLHCSCPLARYWVYQHMCNDTISNNCKDGRYVKGQCTDTLAFSLNMLTWGQREEH